LGVGAQHNHRAQKFGPYPRTSAEKQRRYRERHLGVDGSKERLQLYSGVQARHRGCAMTVVIEQLVADAEVTLLDRLSVKKRVAYFGG
jgi:hypothetical protein